MTIDEYIKEKNNVFWDFSNDCLCIEYKEIEDILEKYFIYKSTSDDALNSIYDNGKKYAAENVKKYRGLIDPDTESDLLQKIYNELWSDLVHKPWMQNKERIQADTMTSLQHTLNELVINEIETEIERKNRGRKRCSTNYVINLYASSPKEFRSRLTEIKGLELYVSMYHTLGNFIPTPCLFNKARSGNLNAEYDYWDLTLAKIKEWYAEKDINKKKIIIKELLHNKGNIETCEAWLKFFGEGENGWLKFVERNYLQDFVIDYEPIMFCENHSWENNEIDDYVEFFITASRLIYLRGKRLIKELMRCTKDENIWN